MTILGFTMGNFWALITIYFSDVLDERIIITKSPSRGATVGIARFFERISRAAIYTSFTLVHILTGFDETNITPTAQLGIRLHMSVIPSIVLLICVLIYWKFYPITPEVWMENKKKLKELGF